MKAGKYQNKPILIRKLSTVYLLCHSKLTLTLFEVVEMASWVEPLGTAAA
jgi:hypothetical protein